MASLHGTRAEHEKESAAFLEECLERVEKALQKFERGKVESAWHEYSLALIAWGSYVAESNWSGRLREEDRVHDLLVRADKRLQGFLGV